MSRAESASVRAAQECQREVVFDSALLIGAVVGGAFFVGRAAFAGRTPGDASLAAKLAIGRVWASVGGWADSAEPDSVLA